MLRLRKIIKETKLSQTPITFRMWFFQKILRFNANAYWPMHFSSKVICPENVKLGVDTNPGYMAGCYIQASAEIIIGDYTQIASNVGVVTANHNPFNNKEHTEPKKISIGKYCWLGLGSVILPGVELGDYTVVGANAVVTKSFKNGYVILAGNPAKPIKSINKEECVAFKNEIEYVGYKRK